MSRWMYVYVAVDCYTYDLLHIRIYAYRNEATARAFLLELRAKGYKPKAIVTDMWSQYNKLIGEIFPAPQGKSVRSLPSRGAEKI